VYETCVLKVPVADVAAGTKIDVILLDVNMNMNNASSALTACFEHMGKRYVFDIVGQASAIRITDTRADDDVDSTDFNRRMMTQQSVAHLYM
jgi:hypothetical protein